jgi:hypothetical protein
VRGGGELLVEALSSDAEALTRGQASFSRWAGFSQFEAGFSWFRLFREQFFSIGPAISGV